MSVSESKKALFIGIDDYDNPKAKLRSCINDARAMSELLKKDENDDPNFAPPILCENPTNEQMQQAIERILLPERAPKHVLIYFSGHGHADETDGYLVGRDYSRERNNMGVSMTWLVEQFNNSKIPFITLILDCCFADEIGQQKTEDDCKDHLHLKNRLSVSCLRENVTILSATKRNDLAQGGPSHGRFTEVLLKGLKGAAADAFGTVTAAGLYSLADGYFSSLQQRPVFKANLTEMPPLRQCAPVMDKAGFRELTGRKFFPNNTGTTQLRPSDICNDPSNDAQVEHFERLIQYQRARLIECPNNESIYKAALGSKSYSLSAFGEFFKEMKEKKGF